MTVSECCRSAVRWAVPDSIKPKLAMATDTEIQQSVEKIARLNRWEKISTLSSMALATLSCIPLGIEGCHAFSSLFTSLGILTIPFLGGSILGAYTGKTTTRKICNSAAATAFYSTASLAIWDSWRSLERRKLFVALYPKDDVVALPFEEVTKFLFFTPVSICVTALIFAASRSLKYMKQDEILAITERNGGYMPEAVAKAWRQE